ncbi:MAG: SpoIID/LytB domain-containing protein [Thermacetogeniaceae bacterium]
MKKLVLLLALLGWLLLPRIALAADVPLIRVALDQGVTSATFQVSKGTYSLVDQATGLPVCAPKQGEPWSVTASGTALLVSGPGLAGAQLFQGPLLLQEASTGELNLFQYKGVLYRGNLVLQNLNGTLLVINVLDIEKYLYGVVGREMGGNSLEALSAQAVVSRSYALSQKGLNPWFDVYSDTRSQVYGGYSAEIAYGSGGSNPVIAAVERTRGQVLKYKGALVKAVFHSNAGGYTEDSENVWVEALPYLRAVPSPEDSYAESVGGWAAGTYRWTKTIERKELEEKLGIGEIREIRISRNRTRVTRDPVTGKWKQEFIPGTTTASGRVTELTVVGTKGTRSFYRDNIRAPFGLKSTLFDLSMEGQLYILNASGSVQTLSAGEVYAVGSGNRTVALSLGDDKAYVIGRGNRVVTQSVYFERVTFVGKGYGHGLGLSQWGARGMAAKGYNYKDILELYYNQGKHNGDLQIVGGYGM